MLALTLVTGLVDAFSYLALGHVFVANVSDNVVFFSFAFARAKSFSLLASSCGRLLLGRGHGGWGTRLAHSRALRSAPQRRVGRAVALPARRGRPHTGEFLPVGERLPLRANCEFGHSDGRSQRGRAQPGDPRPHDDRPHFDDYGTGRRQRSCGWVWITTWPTPGRDRDHARGRCRGRHVTASR